MQEINQVFRPKTDSRSESEMTATEILERDWMKCPGDVKGINWYRENGRTDEEILDFLKSFG